MAKTEAKRFLAQGYCLGFFLTASKLLSSDFRRVASFCGTRHVLRRREWAQVRIKQGLSGALQKTNVDRVQYETRDGVSRMTLIKYCDERRAKA